MKGHFSATSHSHKRYPKFRRSYTFRNSNVEEKIPFRSHVIFFARRVLRLLLCGISLPSFGRENLSAKPNQKCFVGRKKNQNRNFEIKTNILTRRENSDDRNSLWIFVRAFRSAAKRPGNTGYKKLLVF